jgi:hypothetical protein
MRMNTSVALLSRLKNRFTPRLRERGKDTPKIGARDGHDQPFNDHLRESSFLGCQSAGARRPLCAPRRRITISAEQKRRRPPLMTAVTAAIAV